MDTIMWAWTRRQGRQDVGGDRTLYRRLHESPDGRRPFGADVPASRPSVGIRMPSARLKAEKPR